MIEGTNTDLLAALHPPRLPETFATLGLSDLATMAGIGLCLAALILTLLGPVLQRRPHKPSWRQRLREARALPEAERLLALARLAKQRGLALSAEEQRGLYDGSLEAARLEARILRGRGGQG